MSGVDGPAPAAEAPLFWTLMVLALLGELTPPEPARPGPSRTHLWLHSAADRDEEI